MNLLLSLIITQLFQVLKNKIYSKNNFFLPTYPYFYGQGAGNRNVFFWPYMNGLFIFVSYM